MATLSELTELVSDIIQDSFFTDAKILSYLNQGVIEIAGGMQSSLGDFITPPLPELFTIETVNTVVDSAFVAMPATFQRGLRIVTNSSGYELEIYNSMINFVQDYPLLNSSGSIDAVIEQGKNLYYQKIPTESEIITLYFYRLPIAMTELTDTPDGIPLYLQIPLLVNYASWKIFELIEDGIESSEINVKRYKIRFFETLRNFELSIPYDTRSLFLGD